MTTLQHRVRYHEVDQQGFLFNSRFFEIADVALTEFIRELGWSYTELNQLGVDPSVVHVEADFSAPARFDDILEVRTDCVRLGTSSFVLRTQMARGQQELVHMSTTYVNVDAVSARSAPLPSTFASELRRLLLAEAECTDR